MPKVGKLVNQQLIKLDLNYAYLRRGQSREVVHVSICHGPLSFRSGRETSLVAALRRFYRNREATGARAPRADEYQT